MDVQRGGRHILIHGVAMVLAGLLWGTVVPATPHPRLALVAHIQFEVNGLAFIALALVLLGVRHAVGPRSVVVMLLAAWLTWAMLGSQVANTWWGTTEVLPIAAKQAGVTGGAPWQELVVKLAHVSAALLLIAAWALLLVGLLRPAPASGAPAG